MNEFGLIADSHTVSFDCTLPGNADWVWWHLTEPEGLRAWLADGDIEPHVGGKIDLRFQSDEALVQSNCGVRVRGIISCYEPDRRLVYSWQDASREAGLSGGGGDAAEVSRVSFSLVGGGGRTLLSLTHAGLSSSMLSKIGAGWHAHLALLMNVLSEDVQEHSYAQLFDPHVRHGKYTESMSLGMRA